LGVEVEVELEVETVFDTVLDKVVELVLDDGTTTKAWVDDRSAKALSVRRGRY
jgi:hypothetical protein